MRNPLTETRDLNDQRQIQQLFPLVDEAGEARFLALRPYVHKCPERFFSVEVHSLFLNWLIERDASQSTLLHQYLADADPELSAAMLFLRQINSEDWHDRQLIEGDEYDIVRFVDRVLHPAYLRLTEGVFAHLIRPIGVFSRLDRGKPTEGLDVFNLVEELRRGPMAPCVAAYHHTMRNGIGHGGITLLNREVRYRDKKGNTEALDLWSVVRICDDMVDTCNALSSALKVFLVRMKDRGYQTPHEFLVEELMEGTQAPWWNISGCIGSEIPAGKQLIVYAHPASRDPFKIQWSAVHAAALAESLAPGFDRYFFSLRPRSGLPGWAAFDGARLRALRFMGVSEVHEYASAIEEGGFFYMPRPQLPSALRKIDTLVKAGQLQWPHTRRQLRANRGIPEILVRDSRIHRNSWGYVLNGAVVLSQVDNSTAAAIVRAHKRRIIRVAARTARAQTSRLNLVRYLPLGYARIAVFSRDFRRRRLGGFGLGPELICTIQRQRIRRIRAPDIIGSTVESSDGWRIAWNRAWIESGGDLH